MVSQTKINVERKRKIRRKKRRLKFLRLLVVMVIFGLIMTAEIDGFVSRHTIGHIRPMQFTQRFMMTIDSAES